MKNRWTLWIPLVFFAALMAIAAHQLFRPADRDVASAMVGKTIPDFALEPAVEARPGLSAADLADGKPKLLNVFASWCIPCAVEAPQLAELEGAGATIVAVAIRDRSEDVEQFLARYGNPYARIGRDDVSEVQFSIGSSGVPETFVVDGKGVIRYQHIGEIREPDVPMLLEKLREAGA